MSLIIECPDENDMGLPYDLLFGVVMLLLSVELDFSDLGLLSIDDMLSYQEYAPGNGELNRNIYNTADAKVYEKLIGRLFFMEHKSADSEKMLESPFYNSRPMTIHQKILAYVDAICIHVNYAMSYDSVINWDFKPSIIIDPDTLRGSIWFATR